MKIVTLREPLGDPEGVLRRVAKGERFVLFHRGKPAARLEPPDAPSVDAFLTIASRAKPSPKGKSSHSPIDRIQSRHR